MKRKASDYAKGDRFLEANHHDAGTVFSLVLDPTRLDRAFILIRSDDGDFTVYSCLRDAVTEPSLARGIPEPVLQRFLFDVYFGGQKLTYTPGIERVPVRLPELRVKAPPVKEMPEEGEKQAPVGEYGPAPMPEPTPPPEPAFLTPELDFP